MLWAMAPKPKPKKKAPEKTEPLDTMSSPRTIRLPRDDEQWLESLAKAENHPKGFTGVMRDAVKFYRAHKDRERQIVLEAIR